MFDYVLNTNLSLVVNEVWVACVATKSKPWNTLNYWIPPVNKTSLRRRNDVSLYVPVTSQ